jgi:hypothetical protein
MLSTASPMNACQPVTKAFVFGQKTPSMITGGASPSDEWGMAALEGLDLGLRVRTKHAIDEAHRNCMIMRARQVLQRLDRVAALARGGALLSGALSSEAARSTRGQAVLTVISVQAGRPT